MTNDNEIKQSVARLDGFLSGMASMCGAIRDYSAYAYLLDSEDDNSSIESIILSLQRLYKPQTDVSFKNVEELKEGFRELEIVLRDFIIRDNVTESSSPEDKSAINNKKKYLSFLVMDLIGSIIEYKNYIKVYQMQSDSNKSSSECIYFCIPFNSNVLVMQFNNDKPFKKSNRE